MALTEEDEYGKLVTIYISETDRERLAGNERFGKWYDTIRYGSEASPQRPIRTKVAETTIENGVFYPDRYEPELVLERCEKITLKPQPTTNTFRKGARIRQTLHGPGPIITDGYASGTVIKVGKRSVSVHWDESEDQVAPNTYDPVTGWEANPVFPDMTTRIALLEERPAADTKKRRPRKKKGR